jgi:hypothetical protein
MDIIKNAQIRECMKRNKLSGRQTSNLLGMDHSFFAKLLANFELDKNEQQRITNEINKKANDYISNNPKKKPGPKTKKALNLNLLISKDSFLYEDEKSFSKLFLEV